MEQASRRRKEALVETLAAVMMEHSGGALASDRALAIAAVCIQHYYPSITYHLMALGYVYHDRQRTWQRQPRLR